MTVSLPPGWDRSSKNTDLTPYILSLSLVLAVGIVLLIFGCVIWRRKRRGANKDLETKLRRHRTRDDDIDDELDDIARARAQQRRLWVKATARWRPNVKISARRRRKKLGTSVSSDVSSIHSKAESSAAGASPSMEMLSLESSSITTEATNNPLPSAAPPLDITVPDGETPPSEGHEPFLDAPSHELRLAHPPDYREDGANVGARGDVDPPPHSVTSEDAFLDDSPQTAQMTRPAMSLPHVSAAHVATDDKNLLARMATLVSSPPEEDAFVASQSSHDAVVPHAPSVPVIEEFEELSSSHLETMHRDSGKGAEVVWSNHLSSSSTSYQPALSNTLPVPTYSREPSPHPPMFPAPPSKAQLAGFQYYEYPSAFEADMVEPPADPQPSAPMFEYPSAPENDSSRLDAVPCAPPLIDEEDELHLGLGRAYAPPIPPLADDVDAVRTGSDSTSPAPSGASISHPSSQLERTTRPPDYLP
ncbi:hypothetical protein PHLGIDRAFT_272555 [Phlebiopsis gigantea 11061_1 CR5-6]|uniref:Uncharacterized protein n=1 Tax=Phlebiopsis gigantea (strain 11061_1 CR5-6) TaxID=745531 RepID=A0A0C3NXC7_PHLG1|nr:hypothetical protein PHLGIDRAFT_272555 [Phlebiopsis gigantea 11061_1 CR5-6]